MDSIQYTSWSFHEKHGGPAHYPTTTVTVPPITKPTQGMDSGSDSSDNEESGAPISEIDRESAIILAILAFLCFAALFWWYRHRTKIQRRADLERQLSQEREYGVDPGRRQGNHVKSASISLEMKSRSERTESDASKGSESVEEKGAPLRHFSWPKITFSRGSEAAEPKQNDGWRREDSIVSTIAPRSFDEYSYRERGQSFSYRPTYAHYGSRIGYSNPFLPCESVVRRSSLPQARCANRCCTEIGPHSTLPPNQDWPRRQSLREPTTADNVPESTNGTASRSQTHVIPRGRTCSRPVYDWSRPTLTSPSRPGEREGRGVTLGGF